MEENSSLQASKEFVSVKCRETSAKLSLDRPHLIHNGEKQNICDNLNVLKDKKNMDPLRGIHFKTIPYILAAIDRSI